MLNQAAIEKACQSWKEHDHLPEYYAYLQAIQHPQQSINYTPSSPDYASWLEFDVHQIQRLAGQQGYSESFLNFLQRSVLLTPPEILQVSGPLPTGCLLLRLRASLPVLHLLVPELYQWAAVACSPLPPVRVIAFDLNQPTLQVYGNSIAPEFVIAKENSENANFPLLRTVAPPGSPLYLNGTIWWHPDSEGPYFEKALIL